MGTIFVNTLRLPHFALLFNIEFPTNSVDTNPKGMEGVLLGTAQKVLHKVFLSIPF